MLFAPNPPEQNPVEDIWLQGKNLLRKFAYRCKSFTIVKRLFMFFLNRQIFGFPKLYTELPLVEGSFKSRKPLRYEFLSAFCPRGRTHVI